MSRAEYLKPYWLTPKNAKVGLGAVVVHGFTGVPWDVLPVGEGLVSDGYTVDLPLLPGHDEGASGIREIPLDEWRQCVLASLERVYATTKQPVLLVGFSMGGLLVLDCAVKAKIPIAGVVSLAAPLRLGKLARSASKLAASKPWAEPFTWPKFRGSDIEKDLSMPGADGIPLRAVSELDELIEDVRHTLPSLKKPLLVIQARHDHTAPPESPWSIISRAGSSFRRLVILKRGFHVITRDVCWVKVVEEVRAFAKKHGYVAPPKPKKKRRPKSQKK